MKVAYPSVLPEAREALVRLEPDRRYRPLEGVNNKIKVIKRAAFGFQDLDYFALKVKPAFPGRKLSNEMGGELHGKE
jgi:transposase